MPAITAAELAELPRLTREQIAAPTVERGQRIRELYLARPANYDYHKAFVVARILSSERLRTRAKWIRFAKELIEDPGVENRLIDQAMNLIEGKTPASIGKGAIQMMVRFFFQMKIFTVNIYLFIMVSFMTMTIIILFLIPLFIMNIYICI